MIPEKEANFEGLTSLIIMSSYKKKLANDQASFASEASSTNVGNSQGTILDQKQQQVPLGTPSCQYKYPALAPIQYVVSSWSQWHYSYFFARIIVY